MIDSRRNPRPTGPAMKKPSSSGPRCAMERAIRTIVTLTLVDGQTRGFVKRFRKPVFLKEILLIISNPSRKRLSASLVSGESVDFGESLHNEAGVKVINEIAHAVRCIVPRAVCLLIVQDELQVAFSCVEVAIVREYPRSAGEQERAISRGVNDSTAIIGGIGTTAGVFRCLKILDVESSMARDRLDDLFVLLKQLLISVLRPPSSALCFEDLVTL